MSLECPSKPAVTLSFSPLAEHEGKAFHISYEDKLSLVAYTLQVTHGPFNGAKCGPLGYLDVIGRDRRYVAPVHVLQQSTFLKGH